MVESCGTGGDTLKTFNVSTTASIIASSCGAKISKHGNRSVSSKFGGADALEALGVNIELSPEEVVNSLEECGFAFIFAPKYHIATKNVMKIRKELKTRTIFNLIGPITCPSDITARMTGVYDPNLVETVAEFINDKFIRATSALVSVTLSKILFIIFKCSSGLSGAKISFRQEHSKPKSSGVIYFVEILSSQIKATLVLPMLLISSIAF